MEEQTAFKPSLGLVDATMVVAGSMIGSGIFIVSADIARNVGSAGWIIMVWLITGFMTISAALSYGELSGMYPKAGGQYVYLREAFNPLVAFLYGWSFFAVIQTGTIAAVGVAFAKFAGYFFPALNLKDENIFLTLGSVKLYYAQIVAIVIVLVLTYINTKGVKEGKLIQTTFTISKLLALFGLIMCGFLFVQKSYWSENMLSGMFSQKALINQDGSITWESYWRYYAFRSHCIIHGRFHFQQRFLEQCHFYCCRNQESQTKYWLESFSWNAYCYNNLCFCEPDVPQCVAIGTNCKT